MLAELAWQQLALIGLVFVWSGFVRSGLGFGGSVLSLPFMLLIFDQPLFYLPIICVHMQCFALLTLFQNQRKLKHNPALQSSVDWPFLSRAMLVIIIPKLVGVFGLITLAPQLLANIIFCIIAVYSLTYIFNRPFVSKHRSVDILFLMLGGYISGTSLIGGPLLIAVFASHVAREQLRDTLFMLWFVLVSIKLAAFVYAGVDLQLIHHLWLLPCAGLGHLLGLRLHHFLMNRDASVFYRLLGGVLLLSSVIGLVR